MQSNALLLLKVQNCQFIAPTQTANKLLKRGGIIKMNCDKINNITQKNNGIENTIHFREEDNPELIERVRGMLLSSCGNDNFVFKKVLDSVSTDVSLSEKAV